MIFKKIVFIVLLYIIPYICSSKDLSTYYLSLQPYIVSIEVRTPIAAYSDEGTFYGTGAILDKESGIILTNAHVAHSDGVNDLYKITLFNGSIIQGTLLYADPWHDFAFLKVNPKELTEIKGSLPVKKNALKMAEPILMIGKNENNHFSAQTGTIASVYEATESLPSQCFRISLNAQGGASGSPVFNKEGEAIGFLFASNGLTSAFAIPIEYALDALETLKNGQTPKRYATGMIIEYIPIDDHVRHNKLDPNFAKTYKEKYPLAFSRVLTVKTVLSGSPADGILQPGDIISKAFDKEASPSLYELDKIINEKSESLQQKVKMEVIRHGQALTLEVSTYDLHTRTLKKIIQFGKAVFCEMDDNLLRKTGCKDTKVFITSMKVGGGFFDRLPFLPKRSGGASSLIAVTQIEDTPIKNLEDVEKIIPSLIKKQDFTVQFRNYGAEFGFNNEPTFCQTEQIKFISYHPHEGEPEVYSYDEKSKKWSVRAIDVSALNQPNS